MTPKKAILVTSGILGFLGILVSIVIIAIGGGFSGPGASIFNPPSDKDLWRVGNNLVNGTQLIYSLTTTEPNHLINNENISMIFINEGDKWKVLISYDNLKKSITNNISLSKLSFTPVGIVNYGPTSILGQVSSSIFAIRDIAREPKYLVVGAIWDTMDVGTISIPLRITKFENVKTAAGSYDSFVLSYQIGNKESRIFLVRGLPLPIKSEVYSANGTLIYKYELVSFKR